MSTPETVISQLQNDLQSANAATGASDLTVHDAIARLIDGYSAEQGAAKYIGTFTPNGNISSINHGCGSSKYLFIVKAGSIPDNTDDVWRSETVIGLYDANGISFNRSSYNTVSAVTRYKNGSATTVVWNSNSSTNDILVFSGNSLPNGVECNWELYDLSNL